MIGICPALPRTYGSWLWTDWPLRNIHYSNGNGSFLFYEDFLVPQSLKDFYQIDNDYVCLRFVSCPKYCLCLCVVHSRFPPLFFSTFFLFKQFWMYLQGISNLISYTFTIYTQHVYDVLKLLKRFMVVLDCQMIYS